MQVINNLRTEVIEQAIKVLRHSTGNINMERGQRQRVNCEEIVQGVNHEEQPQHYNCEEIHHENNRKAVPQDENCKRVPHYPRCARRMLVHMREVLASDETFNRKTSSTLQDRVDKNSGKNVS